MRRTTMLRFIKISLKFALLFASQIFLSQISTAQFVQASPPIADLSDRRFVDVTEDWTSPALKTSNLKPTQPLPAYINDYPGYTVELLQVQWRFGDPLDLYVMKPKAVRKPPVILYLYGYPAGTDRFKDETFQKTVTKRWICGRGLRIRSHRTSLSRPADAGVVHQRIAGVLSHLGPRRADGLGLSRHPRRSRHEPGRNVYARVGSQHRDPGFGGRIRESKCWMRSTRGVCGRFGWQVLRFAPEDERANYVTPEFLKKAAALDPDRLAAKDAGEEVSPSGCDL